MQSEPTIPNARAFVRSLNVLLKYARLYGLEHSRSAGQFGSAWEELQAAVNAAGPAGLLLGAAGSQLLLDGVPLESSPAERSFADFLNASGVASIGFLPRVEREEFSNLVKCFMDTGPKAGALSERLAVCFTNRSHSGIRVNEIEEAWPRKAHNTTSSNTPTPPGMWLIAPRAVAAEKIAANSGKLTCVVGSKAHSAKAAPKSRMEVRASCVAATVVVGAAIRTPPILASPRSAKIKKLATDASAADAKIRSGVADQPSKTATGSASSSVATPPTLARPSANPPRTNSKRRAMSSDLTPTAP